MKFFTPFKNTSSVKLILASVVLSLVAIFLEKPFPSIFLFLRLTAFALFVYAIIKYFNSKN